MKKTKFRNIRQSKIQQKSVDYITSLPLASKLLLGLIALLLLAHAVQYIFYTMQLYRAEWAYRRADCQQAVDLFSVALKKQRFASYDDSGARAAAHNSECKYYLTLPSNRDSSIEIANAHDFTDRFPGSTLGKRLKENALKAFYKSDVAQLATEPLCDRLPTILSQDWLLDAETTAPQMAYACGNTFLTAGNFAAAILPYQLFLENYPDHVLTALVEASYAQAAIGEAKASGAGVLPPPNPTGYTYGENTVVAIANGSPESMRIIFSGPEPRFEELPPCETCKVHSAPPVESSCSESSPAGVYQLLPGDYQVLVRSVSDRKVTPFTGEWTLASGVGYAECFHIVRNPPSSTNEDKQPEPIPLQ